MNKLNYSFFNRNIEPFNNDTADILNIILNQKVNQLINGNKITINKDDDMTEFVIYKNSNNLNDNYSISIGEKVTEIPERAFENIQINELSFGENSELKKIGVSAFSNSTDNRSSINNLQIPGSVKTININAFSQVKITNDESALLFVVDGSLNTIGDHAFSNWRTNAEDSSLIKNLRIPSSVTTIGSSAFGNVQLNNDEKASLFVVNGSLKTIGSFAFYNNKNNKSLIKNLQIPSSVVTINNAAFGNVQITNDDSENFFQPLFDVDGSLNTIGAGAFSNSTVYKSIIYDLRIPSNVTSIGNKAFQNVQIDELLFEEYSKLEKIGSFAFSNNSSNTDDTKNKSIIYRLIIPSSVTTINESAFQNVQIVELFFRENSKLKEIGKNAFSNNISNTEDRSLINNLKIPSSVTTINESAFQNVQIINDKGVPLFEVDGSLETIGKNAFDNNTENRSLIENLRIPGSVTTICDEAFHKVQIINDKTAPLFDVYGSLKTIGVHAFSNFIENSDDNKNKSSIKNLQIPGSVEIIDEKAFQHVQLTNDDSKNAPLFIVNGSLKHIGPYAFYNYTENRSLIKNLQIPSSVVTIDNTAFKNVQIINENEPLFDVNGSLNTIGINAFYNNTENISSIKNLQIPGSVTTIGNKAFEQVRIINDENAPLFVVNGSLNNIGSRAFSNYRTNAEDSSSIKNLQIPGSVETINAYAFKNVQITNDESAPLFVVDGSLNTIGVYAFYNNTDNRSSIVNLQIPDSVDINNYAFFKVRYCKTNLQEKYGAIDAKCTLPNEIPFKKIIIFIIVVFFIFIVFIVFKKNINLSF